MYHGITRKIKESRLAGAALTALPLALLPVLGHVACGPTNSALALMLAASFASIAAMLWWWREDEQW